MPSNDAFDLHSAIADFQTDDPKLRGFRFGAPYCIPKGKRRSVLMLFNGHSLAEIPLSHARRIAKSLPWCIERTAKAPRCK